jgi:hypothetical protein
MELRSHETLGDSVHGDLFEGEDYSTNVAPTEYVRRAVEFTSVSYPEQLEKYRKIRYIDLKPIGFFHEYVWCVYVSGFNATVISRKWDDLTRVFCGDGGSLLFDAPNASWDEMRPIFANTRKFSAVVSTASLLIGYLDGSTGGTTVDHDGKAIDAVIAGWEEFKQDYLCELSKIRKLPMMGPVTSCHLARNMGLDYVKPDLHLQRLATKWGYISVPIMVEDLAHSLDERIGVIDFCLWNYASTFGSKT